MKWNIRLTSICSFILGIVLLSVAQTNGGKMARTADGTRPQSHIQEASDLSSGSIDPRTLGGRSAHHRETDQTLLPASASMMQMPLVAPLFIEDDDFSSTLVMVNASSLNTFADVVLSGMDGFEITRKRVQFTSHSQQRLQISSLLAAASSRATTGRVEVMQSADLKGMAILAQLLLTHQEPEEPNYIDEETAMPSASGSQTLRGVADKADGSPLVAITSLLDSSQRVIVECLPDHGRIFSKSVDLLPGETLITEACIAKTFHGIDFRTVRDGASRGTHGSVGIALTSDAMPGSFAAFGLAPHEDRGSTFFSGIVFDDPKMILSSTTVFAGVPVGSTDLLPEGNFVPALALTNFSTQGANVRVRHTFYSAGATNVEEVKSIVVPARSSVNFSLENLAGDPGLKNSFLVESDAAPGDIMSKLVSRSGPALREVELLGKDAKEHENGGSHPWSLERETESTLLLFNHSSEAQTVDVFISRPDIPWHKTYHLDSMQTAVINFRSLLLDQVKDDHGKTLSKNILNGQVGWFTSRLGKVKGRLLQSNRGLAIARSFSCTSNYVLAGALFAPNTTTMNTGQIVTFGDVVGLVSIPVGGEIGGCGGTPAQQGGDYSISWTTDNSSIIAISGPYNQASVSVQGGTVGQAFINATLTDNSFGCVASDGTVGTVAPVITGISPSEGLIGTTVSSVVIDGAGFSQPAVVTPNGITANISGSTATRIVANFVIATNASPGKNKVAVTVSGISSNTLDFIVQIPDTMTVVNDTSGPFTTCPAFIQRLHSYSLSAGDILLPNVLIGETGTLGSNNCAGEDPGTSFPGCSAGDTTDANGAFTDRWTVSPEVGCITPQPSNCGYDILDHWQVCSNPANYTMGTLNGYIHADAISINGVVTPGQLLSGSVIPH